MMAAAGLHECPGKERSYETATSAGSTASASARATNLQEDLPSGEAVDRTSPEDPTERTASRRRQERCESECQAASDGPGLHAARSPRQEGGPACSEAAMTTRLPRIILAALCCTLFLATSASAECAWVMWATINGGLYNNVVAPVSALDTQEAWERTVRDQIPKQLATARRGGI